ncbi:MAG: NifU family protein [Ignavibacteria bacterium]|jgi:Fe-S cluster biogenesis protein NfuA|nr:NifU family protein [Ignavibacteria bacterium]MDP3830039.1 NifU family protein [Ignavibacteriaceae bacterium]
MIQVIDVELTPNPQALKFILNEKILKYETRQFQNKDEANSDPLAKLIFDLEGVVSVFYMDKFITVEKTKESQWGQIQRPLVSLLKSFDVSTIPAEQELKGLDEDATQLYRKINEILNQKVRPALAYDGGGLEVLGLDGYTLKIRYQGACGSCPTSIRGTLTAIESLLKKDVNSAIEVIPA